MSRITRRSFSAARTLKESTVADPTQGNDKTIERLDNVVPIQSDDDWLAALDRRNKLMDRVIAYAITATHATQWMSIGGKPYPTGPACEAMARRCSVSVTDIECERTDSDDEKGSFYTWTYRARFSLPGGRDVIHAEGHCSSRDQFLGSPPQKEGGEPPKREPWEVEEGNIRQAAYTNMTNNGITRILGVRNLSWERWEALMGVKRDQVGKVDYQQGARGGGRQTSSDDVEIKWGNGKGKKLSELTDDDVRFYMEAWKKDLGDTAKAKYHASCKKNLEVAESILAKRANAAAGVQSAPAAGNGKPSAWKRILALEEAKGVGAVDLKDVAESTKTATEGWEKLDDDAKVKAVQVALVEWKKKAGVGEDIRF